MPTHSVTPAVDAPASRELSSSYRPGSGRQREAEMDRLDRQAGLTFDAELALMLGHGLRADGTLVDLGSGNGSITRRLRESLPEATVIGADVDAALLALVPAPSLLIRDGRIPLGNDTVDDILVRFVAQHLTRSDRASLWAEVLRVLRPGGRVHVVDVDDSGAGSVHPVEPRLERIYAKVFHAQASLGGDRGALGLAPAELTSAGFVETSRLRDTVSSDEVPLGEFAVHLGPDRYLASVSDGVLSLADLAAIAQAWQAILTAPDGYVSINVHMVRASKPERVPHTEGETP